MSPASNKIALFIDGANLYATAKTLGFDIDYKRLLKEFQSRGTLLRAFYYTAIIEDQEYSSIRPLIDWLDYNGYTVVTKATKEFIDASGRRKVKGNMDIELAVDAMELAEHVDQIVLFSGDGDFRSLVEAVQRRGVRVTVVSTISSQPPMIADELRRQADVFTDLVELQSKLGRDPSERPAPREPRHHAPQFLQRATTMAPRGRRRRIRRLRMRQYAARASVLIETEPGLFVLARVLDATRHRSRIQVRGRLSLENALETWLVSPPLLLSNPAAIARSARGSPNFAHRRARTRTGLVQCAGRLRSAIPTRSS